MGQISKDDAKKFEKDMARQRSGGFWKKMIISAISVAALYYVYINYIAKG